MFDRVLKTFLNDGEYLRQNISRTSVKICISGMRFRVNVFWSWASHLYYWASDVYYNKQINTAQKMKFSIKDFFNKCEQIRRKLRIADLVTFTEEIPWETSF